MHRFARPMTARQRRSCERWRARGEFAFVLVVGVLGWGVAVALLWSAAMAWFDARGSWDWGRFLARLSVAIIGFPLAGVPLGLVRWRVAERRYAASPPGHDRRA